MPTCYRHPTRETGVSCSNCGRPICPDCMTPTTVGMRCPECAKQRTKVVTMRSVAGTVPRVTYGLIAANVLVFLTEAHQFSLYSGNSSGTVVTNGWIDRIDVHLNQQYYRFITAGFLHANLIHILFNMYLLYLLGLMLEPAIGSARFAAIYFTALIAGSAGSLVATAAPSIGASGAIFGLMGAAVVELRARQRSVMESGIGGLIIINLIFSFYAANISVGGHIGGLIGGFLAGLAIRAGDSRRSLALGLAGCVVICAVSFVIGLLAAGSANAGFAFA